MSTADGMATSPPPKRPSDEDLMQEVAKLTQRVSELLAERDRARATADENYANGKKWKSNAEALEKHRDGLLDDLNRMTVEKARLEGYIDRVREFDPQPKPVMVPQRPSRGERLDGYGYTGFGAGPEPWYKRNLERNA